MITMKKKLFVFLGSIFLLFFMFGVFVNLFGDNEILWMTISGFLVTFGLIITYGHIGK